MQNKLYPPQIAGSLPAFYLTRDSISNNVLDTELTIPYSMNQGVGYSQITGFVLYVKNVASGSFVCPPIYSTNFNSEQNEVVFLIKQDQAKIFEEGQFYKIQLAYYMENDPLVEKDIGFFSTVGLIKCVSKPEVSISSYSVGSANVFNGIVMGVYDLSGEQKDKTERIYSYNFKIYDENNDVYYTTGELIHNSENDNLLEGIFTDSTILDSFTFNMNQYFKIQYTVTTINGLVMSSPLYRITSSNLSIAGNGLRLQLLPNNDDGHIVVNITKQQNSNSVYGNFILSRSSEQDNFNRWLNLYEFNYQDKDIFFKDFTVEHGIKYKYSISQFNTWGVCTDRIESDIVHVDFEDMFLFDGKRQLKIRFNPGMNKFGTTLLESKVNTIGNKFPYFFRNGQASYKEFPISGLISYQMDDSNLFYSTDNSSKFISRLDSDVSREQIADYTDFDLVEENILKERKFKLEVLDWLNDGEIKLFKSSTEGNYFVRLMKISLKPEKKLGRMLHSFSCTAYEVAEFSYENLHKLGFIDKLSLNSKILLYKTVNLSDYPAGKDIEINFEESLYSFSAQDMKPGQKILLYTTNLQAPIEIMIGATGAYNYENSSYTINKIVIPAETNDIILGVLNCQYYDIQHSEFDIVKSVSLKTIIGQQYIGIDPYFIALKNDPILDGSDTYQEFLKDTDFRMIPNNEINKDFQKSFIPGNIIYYINNSLCDRQKTKVKLLNIEQAHLIKRDIIPLYRIKGEQDSSDPLKQTWSFNEDPQSEDILINFESNAQDVLSSFPLYQLIDTFTGAKYYYDFYWANKYNDFQVGLMTSSINQNNIFKFSINGQPDIDLQVCQEMYLEDLGAVSSLVINPGVIAELTFQVQVIGFDIEDRDLNLIKKRELYLEKVNLFNNMFKFYNNLSTAHYGVIKYRALYKAYSLLLEGTKPTNKLNVIDILTLSALLNLSTISIETLNLIKKIDNKVFTETQYQYPMDEESDFNEILNIYIARAQSEFDKNSQKMQINELNKVKENVLKIYNNKDTINELKLIDLEEQDLRELLTTQNIDSLREKEPKVRTLSEEIAENYKQLNDDKESEIKSFDIAKTNIYNSVNNYNLELQTFAMELGVMAKLAEEAAIDGITTVTLMTKLENIYNYYSQQNLKEEQEIVKINEYTKIANQVSKNVTNILNDLKIYEAIKVDEQTDDKSFDNFVLDKEKKLLSQLAEEMTKLADIYSKINDGSEYINLNNIITSISNTVDTFFEEYPSLENNYSAPEFERNSTLENSDNTTVVTADTDAKIADIYFVFGIPDNISGDISTNEQNTRTNIIINFTKTLINIIDPKQTTEISDFFIRVFNQMTSLTSVLNYGYGNRTGVNHYLEQFNNEIANKIQDKTKEKLKESGWNIFIKDFNNSIQLRPTVDLSYTKNVYFNLLPNLFENNEIFSGTELNEQNEIVTLKFKFPSSMDDSNISNLITENMKISKDDDIYNILLNYFKLIQLDKHPQLYIIDTYLDNFFGLNSNSKQGLFTQYIKTNIDDQLNESEVLLKSIESILKSYAAKAQDYQKKQILYKNQYDNSTSTYNSYKNNSNSEISDFYFGDNSNPMSSLERQIKDNWSEYMIALDKALTNEIQTGVYL